MTDLRWLACIAAGIGVTLFVWIMIWFAEASGIPGALFVTFCSAVVVCAMMEITKER